MVAFHDALKISWIPFPFPYSQTCDLLLVVFCLLTPAVKSTSDYHPGWIAIFSFFQTFVPWCLRFISMELEQPFGSAANDLDITHMQEELNQHLMMLLSPQSLETPKLAPGFKDLLIDNNWQEVANCSQLGVCLLPDSGVEHKRATKSLHDVWDRLSRQNSITQAPARRTRRSTRHSSIARLSRHGEIAGTSRMSSIRASESFLGSSSSLLGKRLFSNASKASFCQSSASDGFCLRGGTSGGLKSSKPMCATPPSTPLASQSIGTQPWLIGRLNSGSSLASGVEKKSQGSIDAQPAFDERSTERSTTSL